MPSGILSRGVFAHAPFAVIEIDLRKTRDLIKSPDISFDDDTSWDQALVRSLTNSLEILDLNAAARSILLSHEKPALEHVSHIIPETLEKPFVRGLLRLLNGLSFSMEGILKSPDGSLFPAHISGWKNGQSGQQDRAILGITKLHQSRDSETFNVLGDIAHAGRISMLGEMTASISHEVNQPLGSIVTSAEAGLRWLSHEQPNLGEVRTLLERIANSGRRAGNIIAALKGLARNTKPDRKAVDIAALIDEAVLILRSDLSHRQIALRLELAPDLVPVWIDRTQILQVLVNLVTNAAQAMADGQAWNRTLAIRARKDQRRVTVEVEDSGPGVDPKVRERLFESFYTTKIGGVGMGLAICRSIIEAHGSTIELQSSQYLGAQFSFSLPTEPDADGLAARPLLA